jgi:ribosomal protein S8
MNFRVSIKQVLARIQVAVKKKDLKVIISFKKELIPFLGVLRKEGLIYKFTVQQKIIVLCLKKGKVIVRSQQKQKILRDFDISSVLYKNPTALIFFSSTVGVCTKRYSKCKQKKLGGTQLFFTY